MSGSPINYGNIIKALRKKHNLTQTELGQRVSIGKTAISNYEIGYSIPSARVLEKIAAAFDLTLVELLTPESEYLSPDKFGLPRESQYGAGINIPYLKEENVTGSVIDSRHYMDSQLRLPKFMTESDNGYICVKMPDNSMEGDKINKNDYLIIKKESHPENRKIVLALHRDTNKYLIRRYIREGHASNFIPSSSSAEYSIIRTDERDGDYRIVGYVEKALVTIR